MRNFFWLDVDSRGAHYAAMDIKATREAMGLSATQMAERLGVAPSTIYRLEAGDIALTNRMKAHIETLAKSMRVKVVENHS